jgi:predicted nucleic acid-binding Zn ribbon protein
MTKSCKNCQTNISSKEKFCSKCGTPIVFSHQTLKPKYGIALGFVGVLLVAGIVILVSRASTPSIRSIQDTNAVTNALEAQIKHNTPKPKPAPDASAQNLQSKLLQSGTCTRIISSYAYNNQAPTLFRSDHLRICADDINTYIVLTGAISKAEKNGMNQNTSFVNNDPVWGSDSQGISIGDGACGHDLNGSNYTVLVCQSNSDMTVMADAIDQVHSALGD